MLLSPSFHKYDIVNYFFNKCPPSFWLFLSIWKHLAISLYLHAAATTVSFREGFTYVLHQQRHDSFCVGAAAWDSSTWSYLK